MGSSQSPAASTVGKTIGDQLDARGLHWKSYQESLSLGSIFGVNYSNGTATNLTDFTTLAPLTSSDVVQLYAVKHNPFAYFASSRTATNATTAWPTGGLRWPARPLCRSGQSGRCAGLAFIVPNQCDDQHGRGNSDAFCAFDYGQNDSGYTYGTQVD